VVCRCLQWSSHAGPRTMLGPPRQPPSSSSGAEKTHAVSCAIFSFVKNHERSDYFVNTGSGQIICTRKIEQKVFSRREVVGFREHPVYSRHLPKLVLRPALPGALQEGQVYSVRGLTFRSVRFDVRKTPLFAPFIYKNDHFTKTGSGQT
jgi:hypothetical protein